MTRTPRRYWAAAGTTGRAPIPCPPGAIGPKWRTSFFIRPHQEWAVWQVHYFARVDGIQGRVDLDVVRPARLES